MKIEIEELKRSHINKLWQAITENPLYNFIFEADTNPELIKWFLELEKRSGWHKWEERWLTIKLNSKIIGFVSFNGDSQDKEIQIFLLKKYQGQGYGLISLKLAEKWAKKTFKKLCLIRANIEYGNTASILMFRKAGYIQEYFDDHKKYF